MSKRETEQLIKLAKTRRKRKVSKKDVLQTFISAGILDNEGQFTDNFPCLQKLLNVKCPMNDVIEKNNEVYVRIIGVQEFLKDLKIALPKESYIDLVRVSILGRRRE